MFESANNSDAVEAVERVAQQIGLSRSPFEIRAARDRVPRDEGDQGWRARVAEAGADLALRVTFVEADARAAGRLAREHGPLIGWDRAAGRLVTVVGIQGDDVEVAGEDGVVVRSALLEADPWWAVVEPSAPLAAAEQRHAPTPHQRVLSLLAEERPDLKVVLAYAVAIGLLSLAVPIAIQALVNSVAFGTLMQPVVVLTILVGVALAFAGFLRVLQATIVEWMQQRIFVRVAADMADRLATVRRDAVGSTFVPELANRFFDVVTVQKSAATLLLDGVALLLQTAVGMLLLAFYHPLLLAFDVVLLALVAVVVFGLGRGAVETSIKESKAKYAMASWLEEVARHPTTFRSAHGRALALDRVDDLATLYVMQRRKHWKILVRQIIGTKALQALASSALLGVGGVLVIQRQLTLGQLVAAELIVTSVLSAIAKFGKQLESYYDLVAAVDKLGHVIDLPREPQGREELVRSAAGLDLDLRGIAIVPTSAPVNLRIGAGERVAIRGANGAGKSALVDVAYGLAEPARGVALADGVDLRTIDRASYRAQVAVVRGNEVFEGSIVENVRLGRTEISEVAVRAAIVSLGLLDELLALPLGLATGLTKSGAPLSAGQTRRLMLARAIVGNPRLLVLDEALDGVDDHARARIASVLFDRGAPWSVLVTTHVPEVAALCDVRYRLERGALTREVSA